MKSKLVTVISLLAACIMIMTSCATVPGGSRVYSAGDAETDMTEGSVVYADSYPSDMPSAASAPVPAPVDVSQSSDAPARLKIYTANLTLIVDNVYETQKRIKNVAEQCQGFLQTMDTSSIVIKVPAGSFEDAVRQIEVMGEVTAREIKTKDVTEQVQALHISLDNAEKLRKRLLKLLEDTVRIEDAIKIEQELARLTETIEQIEGAIRLLKHQVTYSTISVKLNSPVPQRMTKDVIPFDWVRNLARNMDVTEDRYYFNAVVESDANCDLPAGFATFYASRTCIRSTSPDGVYLRIHRQTNAENADLDFWSKLVSRSLKENSAMNITAARNITLDDGSPASIIEGTRDLDAKKTGYAVMLALTEEPWVGNTQRIYVYEAWGPEESLQTAMPDIEQSMKTMKVKSWFERIF
jgi:hypothetical protein